MPDILANKPNRVVVLLNEAAGTVVCQDGRSLGETITTGFAQHGIEAALQCLSGTELQQGAERAVADVGERQLDAIIVGGGDGSIASVARAAANTEVPIGILPLGTFNHFARDLGIPAGLEAAIDIIAAGQTHHVDLAEVNGEIFVNNSSIGIYPYLVIDRERLRQQHRLGKWTSMVLATWRTLRNFPLRRLHVRTGRQEELYRSPCLFVGNNEYSLVGMQAGKRSRLNDGELCVYVAKRQSRWSLFWLACRSLVGFMDQERDLHMVKVPRARITSRTTRLLVSLDGEVTILRPPLRYRVRPSALRVFAPKTES